MSFLFFILFLTEFDSHRCPLHTFLEPWLRESFDDIAGGTTHHLKLPFGMGIRHGMITDALRCLTTYLISRRVI